MARTPSTMLELGTPAPDFALPDTDDAVVRLSDFQGAPALLVAFICNHCPYVIHLREALAAFGREQGARGLAMVAISSNDVDGYPADSPEKMAEEKALAGYTFPYLYDATQAVAQSYEAACTPDFFLFDGDQRLVYRGQFDGSRPGNDVPVTGEDLEAAVSAVLAGEQPDSEQRASLGCNIKWKPGNEPSYFG
ncbi:MAG: thioredoxin family protein [Myxococcota bacterium]|nr:thioredoxin family protein [Myxococcota bacterium]